MTGEPQHQISHGQGPGDDGFFRVMRAIALTVVSTIAALASLWTFTKLLLFIDPFLAAWVPLGAFVLGCLAIIVLVLFLSLMRNREADRPKYTIVASVSCLLVALGMLGIGTKEIPHSKIAQQELAKRGLGASSSGLRSQLEVLNFQALSLFSQAELSVDNAFEVLGQKAPSQQGEPLILNVIDRMKLKDVDGRKDMICNLLQWMAQTRGVEEEANSDSSFLSTIGSGTVGFFEWIAQGVSIMPEDDDTTYQYCRPVDGAADSFRAFIEGGFIDHTIPGRVGNGQDERVIRRSLLGFALSRGAPELAAALIEEGANPFCAGYDPEAEPADTYVFDPYHYVWSTFDEDERGKVIEALQEKGLSPSAWTIEQFEKEAEELDNISGGNSRADCLLSTDEGIRNADDCFWLENAILRYRGEKRNSGTKDGPVDVAPGYTYEEWSDDAMQTRKKLGTLDFGGKMGAVRPQIVSETAIIEGRVMKDGSAVFLRIGACPLARNNAELFVVRDLEGSGVTFKRYTGNHDGSDLQLTSGPGETLELRALDGAREK